MTGAILDDISHRRYNPLRGSWILVSPHRMKRPWQGQHEQTPTTSLPQYEASCTLCPGNRRAEGAINRRYDSTFVFLNDYSAVKEQQQEYVPAPQDGSLSDRLLRASPVTGKCYVTTFSPSHNLTMADMTVAELLAVVKLWTSIYAAHLSPISSLITTAPAITRVSSLYPISDITKPTDQYRYMQIFENKGAAMGCSNPHPHGQIWTTSSLPEEPSLELEQLRNYRQEQNGAHLLVDYARLELEEKDRVVFENNTWVVVCPWWATWPFETLVISKEHRRALTDLSAAERDGLAEALGEVTRRYDNLFETQFPYSMGIHQAPLEGSPSEIEASHLHLHFYPPLLRSATVRKFLVGYEMMAEPQRDITPEHAAARLRDSGGQLYRRRPLGT